jgi:hypothetical protein
MTVCIAVGCDCSLDGKNPKAIFVSDFLFTMGYTSTEAGIKTRKLGKRWHVAFSGDDTSHTNEVMANAQKELRDQEKISAFDAANAIVESYHLVRERQIENRFLRTYKMTMDQFLQTGKKIFPASHYLNMLYEIERYDLGCQFLAGGFTSDSSPMPSFFTVTNPGEFTPFDNIGYCAIGSGFANAISYLARRNQTVFSTYERSLYSAIAAKHLAEKAPGVGPQTLVIVQECGVDEPIWLESEQIEAISKIWREEEEKIGPSNLETRVHDILGHK